MANPILNQTDLPCLANTTNTIYKKKHAYTHFKRGNHGGFLPECITEYVTWKEESYFPSPHA